VLQVIGVTLALWGLLELGLRIRDALHHRGGREQDRGTRVAIVVGLGAAFALAAFAREGVPALAAPSAAQAVGVAVAWFGLATRAWAVATLGSSFRTTVEVDPGQAVVSAGPYRWVRHPSYTGLLLIAAGSGLAFGNWLSMAACLVLPPLAIVRRIRIEEAELERVLGEPYLAYEMRTTRLIPRIW